MPLPPAIEFLAAQVGPSGNRLCHFAITQQAFVLPANTSLTLTILPSETAYMDYWFRLMADASMVPGAARIEVFQAGTPTYSGTAFGSSLDRELDFFVRRTVAAPTTTRAINLTNLNQRFIFYSQFLVVATEADYWELERRLSEHFTPVAVERGTPPVDLSGIERRLDELVGIVRGGQVATEPPPLRNERRRVIGPHAERAR